MERVMMDRPFEAKVAEIEASFRNLGAELSALGTALEAIEKCSINARGLFHAVQDRRQELMADLAMLRADIRRMP
jgi:hypothetical protein